MSGTGILVIGGGSAGLAAAARLARGGARVLVLDRAPPGGAHKPPGSGLLLPGLPDGPQRLRAALGEERAASIEAVAERGRQHLLACGRAVEGPILMVPCNGVERDELPATLHPYGAARAGSRWPAGTMSVTSGCIDPSFAFEALAGAARAAGAQIREGAAVQRVETAPGGCRVSCAGMPAVEAECVLIAAGLGSRSLTGAAAAHLYPCRGQAFDVSPGVGRVAPLGAVRRWGHEEYLFRPDRVSLLAWSPESMADDISETPVYGEAFERHVLKSASEWTGSPRAANRTLRRASAFAWPRDGLPLAGPEAGGARVWIAAGFLGRSLTLGVGCGLAVADAMLGRPDALPTSLAPRRMET